MGEYNHGKKEGIGTLIYSDKNIYKGEWITNNMEGFGIYTYADGRQYIGEWKNNQMYGYGEFLWKEGKKYAGFFKNDKRDGFGIVYYPNNKFFIGFWQEGKEEGLGKCINDDEIKYGIWKEGEREKWIENEGEFSNILGQKKVNYASFFLWDKTQLKKFMDINDIDNYNENNDQNSFSKKNKVI